MPDVDDLKEGKKYYTDTPQKTEGFFLKGSNSLDWGMKNRLGRIFNPKSGRTVMLAIDHGYFQGPTTGLERIDLNIMPLVPYADTLMLTRGILRTIVPPSISQSIVMRVSGGTSILRDLSGPYVLVVNAESQVESRYIRPGPKTGTMRVIEEGLTMNDSVIVKGLQRARPGITVTAEPATGSE